MAKKKTAKKKPRKKAAKKNKKEPEQMKIIAVNEDDEKTFIGTKSEVTREVLDQLCFSNWKSLLAQRAALFTNVERSSGAPSRD